MLHRNKLLFLSSTEIRLFQVTRAISFSIPFFDSRKKEVSIYIGFRYRYQIMASGTKYFHIDASDIFVPPMQRRTSAIKEGF
jgi:hypothetical protein